MATQTINYGLTKPDGSDYYDIEVQNGNMDIIDEELKGHSSSLADFMNFLNKGGTIGDTLTLDTETVANQDNISTSKQLLTFSATSSTAVKKTIAFDVENGVLRQGSSPAKAISLGNADYPWNDVYAGIFSKTSPGYTKLPNGFILQWGEYYGSSNNLSFPVAFPTACLGMIFDPDINTTASPVYKPKVGLIAKNNAGFTASCYGYEELGVNGVLSSDMKWLRTVGSANLNAKVKYWAIGY